MSNVGKQSAVDPDDDVDDLDDVLDAFKVDSNPNRPASQPPTDPPASSTAPGEDSASGEDPANLFGEEFAAQLQEGMTELLKELGQAPKDGEDPNELAKMREAWEQMLIAGMDGADGINLSSGTPPATNSTSPPPKAKDAPTPSKAGPSNKPSENNFQETIRQAMEKLKDSEDVLKAASENDSDPLAKLLGDLNLDDLDLGKDGEGGNMQEMLEGMMSQLMSKEILYDSLKELSSKYPEFLKDSASKLPKEDRERYEKQASKAQEIVSVFEKSDYSDENPEYQMQILHLMNEMQSYGAPPTEIMGEMPPGMSLGNDGMPDLENCIIS